MRMRQLIPIALLVVSGCGDGPPPPEIISPESAEPPPPVPSPGTIEGAGARFKPGWSIAFWNEEEEELVFGFLEDQPTAESLNTIKELKSLRATFGVPAIEIGVKFKMKGSVPDIASPIYYRVVYFGFPKGGAVNLVQYPDSSPGWDMQVKGDLMSGGNVQGHFAGANYWSWSVGSKDEEYYGWNVEFDLPVH